MGTGSLPLGTGFSYSEEMELFVLCSCPSAGAGPRAGGEWMWVLCLLPFSCTRERWPPCSDLGPTDGSNSELGRVCVTFKWVFKTLKNVQQNVNSYLWGSETMGDSLLLLCFLKIYYLNVLS